jgi:hypothetical protein
MENSLEKTLSPSNQNTVTLQSFSSDRHTTLQTQTEDTEPYVLVKVYGSPLDKQRLIELRNNTSQKTISVWMSSDALVQLQQQQQFPQRQHQMYPFSVRLTIEFSSLC